jgi:microcystin-dependent protein
MAEVFLGSLMLVPYNFAPKGFAFCQGQSLSIRQYTALFSLLGTTYGGDGVSTFALPNLQASLAVGAGQGPGLSNYDMGQDGGNTTVTLLTSEVPAHIHVISGTDAPASETGPVSNGLGRTNSPNNIYSDVLSPAVPMNQALIPPLGNNQPHNNMMPYTVLNWIIALEGIFPQRG